MGVIEARRRILLSAPHPVTTTPAPVASFNTDMVGKLKSAKFGFLPVQSGSGDPSPTNVRSISGWDGVTVYLSGSDTSNPTTYTITWQSAGTIYGGTLDVTTGLLTVDKAEIDFGTLTWSYNSEYAFLQSSRFDTTTEHIFGTIPDILVGIYKTVASKSLAELGNLPDMSVTMRNTYNALTVKDSRFTDGVSYKEAISGTKCVYPLATPQTYQLTPQIIKSLRGANNLWSNANGDTQVTYWTH